MFLQDNPFVTSGTYMYVSLTKSLFKSAGITVSHFFSMLPYALKYLYSVGPVGTHFPAKQPCTNDTVCICTRLFHGKMHSDWFNGIEILQGRWQHGEKVGYSYPIRLEKTLCKWDIYVPLVTKGLKRKPMQYFESFTSCTLCNNRKFIQHYVRGNRISPCLQATVLRAALPIGWTKCVLTLLLASG